jgi:hypothetical protein
VEAKAIVELILATVIEEEDLRFLNAIHNRRSADGVGVC